MNSKTTLESLKCYVFHSLRRSAYVSFFEPLRYHDLLFVMCSTRSSVAIDSLHRRSFGSDATPFERCMHHGHALDTLGCFMMMKKALFRRGRAKVGKDRRQRCWGSRRSRKLVRKCAHTATVDSAHHGMVTQRVRPLRSCVVAVLPALKSNRFRVTCLL